MQHLLVLARHPGMKPPEETPEQAEKQRDEFFRADQRCQCPVCGYTYIEHPEDAVLEWLHVLCNGWGVKL